MVQSPPEVPGSKKPSLPVGIFFTLLKTAYHLLYHQLAFAYDAVAWIVSLGEWPAWRRCAIPFLKPGPVLEIAHGTGWLSMEMVAAGWTVTAIDRSPAMTGIASARIRSRRPPRGNRAGPALVRADAMQLPFRASCFPNAVCTFPSEFILDPQAIREIGRCLEDGGRLVIVPSALPEFLAARYFDVRRGDSANWIRQFLELHMQPAGFQTHVDIIRRPRSRVLVVVAEKTASSGADQRTK
jgi:ubiquinone/menaquinone biosynthesis C-methylase UbiE